jgi:hypothetical protein
MRNMAYLKLCSVHGCTIAAANTAQAAAVIGRMAGVRFVVQMSVCVYVSLYWLSQFVRERCNPEVL